MTPTQIARRSDALYADGTRGMTRRVLCDMVAQRESDLEDARDENAKLRAARDVWAENDAKLRELVRDVYAVHWSGLDCTECPWFDECDTTGGCHWLSIFIDHMRELGIEVDE